MKILFIIESLRSGGKERRLVELIKGLTLYTDMEMEIILTKDDIHYKDVFKTKIKIHYAIRKEGLKKDPRLFYNFYKIAKKTKPDIIHVWGNLVAIYAIPAKFFLRIPMLNNQIADAPSIVSNNILSHKLSFPFSDKILSNSYAGLISYKPPNQRSSVIYNGFDFCRINKLEDKKKIREKFNIDTELVVGMVASFSDLKDYASYMKAANIILKVNRKVTFLCVGAGDDTQYKKMVGTQNKKNILFLGKQSGIESIMNVCDIGVLSTYTEGISNALLEFSALGKPVVTTFGGGNVELVEQGKTGYLVNQESPGELAEKIGILLNEAKKRREFGVLGKQKVMQQFSMDKMISKFIKLYKTVYEKSDV